MKNKERCAPDRPVIETRNLNKTYKKSRQRITVLHDINLEITQGEIVAITGASGSGKSTLLHLLAGLDRPTSGQVIVNGQDLSKLSDKRLSQFRNQTIGFIFQSFYLHPFLTLEKNVEVPAMFLKMKRDQRASQISQLLERVGLADWAKHFPKELSGGQIQRAAIARALVNSPKIIFADEPTGNLDSTNSDLVIDLLKQIRQDLGTTIVLVTHNPEIVAKADRHIMLKDGVIVSQSSASPMTSRPNISGASMTTSQLPPVEIKALGFALNTRFSQPYNKPQNAATLAPPVRLDARRRQQRDQAENRGFTTEALQQPNHSQENKL